MHVSCDVSGVKQKLNELAANIAALAPAKGEQSTVLQEFVAWQEEDMNRKFPNVVIVGDMTAMTRIWPRGRQASKPRAKKAVKGPRRRRMAAPTVVRKGRVVAGGGRPILRPELFQKLCERMGAMLAKVPPWA